MRVPDILVVLAAFGTITTPTLASEAHRHGHASLRIALDGPVLQLMSEVPGMDAVGFEKAPESDEEMAAVEAALQSLKAAELFVPNAEAGCEPTAALAELEQDGDHAGFEVQREWQCAEPAALAGMATDWFSRFPASRELDVEAIGPGGQSAQDLSGGAGFVDLSAIRGQ